jgi:hypothetical protein
MITRSIEVMLSKPGIYVIGGPWGMSAYEVDGAGRCWSIVPETMERDNELPEGGWNIHAIGVIFGPLARVPADPKQHNLPGEQRIIPQPQPGEPPWPNSSIST